MSTRCTIAYRQNRWHIFDELRDDSVWLEIEASDTGDEPEFESSPASVAVRLPAELAAAIVPMLLAREEKLRIEAETRRIISASKGEAGR